MPADTRNGGWSGTIERLRVCVGSCCLPPIKTQTLFAFSRRATRGLVTSYKSEAIIYSSESFTSEYKNRFFWLKSELSASALPLSGEYRHRTLAQMAHATISWSWTMIACAVSIKQREEYVFKHRHVILMGAWWKDGWKFCSLRTRFNPVNQKQVYDELQEPHRPNTQKSLCGDERPQSFNMHYCISWGSWGWSVGTVDTGGSRPPVSSLAMSAFWSDCRYSAQV